MTEKQMLKYKYKKCKIRYRMNHNSNIILELEGTVIPQECKIYVNRNNVLREYKHYDFLITKDGKGDYIYYYQVKDIVEIKEVEND